MATHEFGEVAHRLHRHCLVEQLQCLFVLDTKAATEPRAIRRETVEQLTTRAAQFLAQGGDIAAEAGEGFRNAKRALGRDEQACRLPLRVFQPEDLSQGHRLVITFITEHAEDDRVARRIAQRHRLGGASHLIALALVVAHHVGAQGPLLGLRSRCLVVGYAVRWHEQSGEGIDQGRLARTDVARQQTVATVEWQPPHPLVERAPVQHLQPLQAEAHPAVVAHEVQVQSGRLKHP